MTLNIPRLETIKNWLLAPKVNPELAFDMFSFVDTSCDLVTEENICGTSCCIAGFAVIKFGNKMQKETVQWFTDEPECRPNIPWVYWAADLLGLTYDQSVWLFLGKFSDTNLSEITAEQAARAIDFIINHPNEDYKIDLADGSRSNHIVL